MAASTQGRRTDTDFPEHPGFARCVPEPLPSPAQTGRPDANTPHASSTDTSLPGRPAPASPPSKRELPLPLGLQEQTSPQASQRSRVEPPRGRSPEQPTCEQRRLKPKKGAQGTSSSHEAQLRWDRRRLGEGARSPCHVSHTRRNPWEPGRGRGRRAAWDGVGEGTHQVGVGGIGVVLGEGDVDGQGHAVGKDGQ